MREYQKRERWKNYVKGEIKLSWMQKDKGEINNMVKRQSTTKGGQSAVNPIDKANVDRNTDDEQDGWSGIGWGGARLAVGRVISTRIDRGQGRLTVVPQKFQNS